MALWSRNVLQECSHWRRYLIRQESFLILIYQAPKTHSYFFINNFILHILQVIYLLLWSFHTKIVYAFLSLSCATVCPLCCFIACSVTSFFFWTVNFFVVLSRRPQWRYAVCRSFPHYCALSSSYHFIWLTFKNSFQKFIGSLFRYGLVSVSSYVVGTRTKRFESSLTTKMLQTLNLTRLDSTRLAQRDGFRIFHAMRIDLLLQHRSESNAVRLDWTRFS